ncbi:MAG: sulfotransferase [Candidatus Thorarchaeota archaeon]
MRISRTAASSKHKEFDFPTPMYFIAKMMRSFPSLASTLHNLESAMMRKRIEDVHVDRPTYITGMARAGTTVVLEMLSQHPDIGAHRYLHMVLPYTPHYVQLIANYLPLMTKPTERVHKDGMIVTRDSPEAVEEIFWQKYFVDTVDESKSNLLDETTTHPTFESFYDLHLRKLLVNQNATRYLAKNNYNVARMEYILKLYPGAKFILMIRNPFNHIASAAKQDGIFEEMERADPRLLDWTKIIGHREFGSAKFCINMGSTETVEKIRQLWSKRDTYVKGWAIYWDAVYSHVHERLTNNPELAKASLLVRYEDLCNSPVEMIDKITTHLELDADKFSHVKEHYVATLRAPSYYRTKYSEKEQEDIIAATGETASKFGYTL